MTAAAPSWRLLADAASDAAWNMAVDEALLEAYALGSASDRPTLRLYGWSPPALSLGRKQPARGAHDPAFLRREGIELVRRPTGGRAVLHEHERTYAVAGRLGGEPFPGGVLDTYRRIAAAIVAGLRELGIDAADAGASRGRAVPATGPPVCFDAPGAHEITVRGRKLVGSAQVRRRGAFLQHGSILIRADAARLGAAVGFPADPDAITGLEDERPGVTPAEIDAALTRGFERAFGAALRPGGLSEGEALRAAELRCWKYDSAAWTYDGRPGERERRWGPPIPA